MGLDDEKLNVENKSLTVNLPKARRGRLARENKFTRLVLTPRDFDVLKFVIEMRFATREELFRRFFETTLSGTKATSPEFMRRRLNELEKNGLLVKERNFVTHEVCFIGTELSQKILQEKYPHNFFPRAIKQMYWVNFIHDQLVLESRIEFERQLKIVEWISDHSLKSLCKKMFDLDAKYSPDGVYRAPDGPRIAFELENSRKQKYLYREKIDKYAKILEHRKYHPGMFRKVHFKCVTKSVFEIIKKEVDWHHDKFVVELIGNNAEAPAHSFETEDVDDTDSNWLDDL
ncbi:MAG: hypothetical protein EOP06_11440 [Proteobacteria bacterium]|nr:MAG: hypothetical protein EOP06_11440 [Pseudomonadota bacterium]